MAVGLGGPLGEHLSPKLGKPLIEHLARVYMVSPPFILFPCTPTLFMCLSPLTRTLSLLFPIAGPSLHYEAQGLEPRAHMLSRRLGCDDSHSDSERAQNAVRPLHSAVPPPSKQCLVGILLYAAGVTRNSFFHLQARIASCWLVIYSCHYCMAEQRGTKNCNSFDQQFCWLSLDSSY